MTGKKEVDSETKEYLTGTIDKVSAQQFIDQYSSDNVKAAKTAFDQHQFNKDITLEASKILLDWLQDTPTRAFNESNFFGFYHDVVVDMKHNSFDFFDQFDEEWVNKVYTVFAVHTNKKANPNMLEPFVCYPYDDQKSTTYPMHEQALDSVCNISDGDLKIQALAQIQMIDNSRDIERYDNKIRTVLEDSMNDKKSIEAVSKILKSPDFLRETAYRLKDHPLLKEKGAHRYNPNHIEARINPKPLLRLFIKSVRAIEQREKIDDIVTSLVKIEAHESTWSDEESADDVVTNNGEKKNLGFYNKDLYTIGLALEDDIKTTLDIVSKKFDDLNLEAKKSAILV